MHGSFAESLMDDIEVESETVMLIYPVFDELAITTENRGPLG